ncbi:MAG TPA: bifunctional 4-hydroxy-2-oxoglutarate aldolase/2-dehydro-3-deoxy-phosphogluconate aldolase [Parafilimonas sp.]|nr:bifunctional 4-hydroxy-2-oxoglutarate aldolase/2-dehydro-3-deoxy-phosphogluconate aldolase [Parafilimonas sp.]
MDDLLVRALRQKILPAVVFYDEENILPVAESFLNAGLNVMEIPFRTSVTWHAISSIRKAFPEMVVGAGTILNINSLKDAVNAGAQFGLSSSLNSKVCSEANQINFPFIPGVMTPSEIESAYELGHTIQKLFPTAQLGGASFLKAMLGPYEQLNLQFIPMGGVTLSNIKDYLRLKNVIAVGGTWLATKEMMIKKEYEAIEATVTEALRYAGMSND